MNSPTNIAVIGGGMLGITLALRLSQQGKSVSLFEAADHLGGLADGWSLGDVTWDRHYHVTLLSDAYTRGLLREVGLDDDMRWVETKTGFFTDGRLHSMSSAWEFLRFPPLPLWAKFRLGLTIFAGSKIRNWKKLEKILVADWLHKWSGKKTLEKIWLPLLRSKLGDNYRRTSAAFIWATIARLYAARRTGLKKELFGYLPGGYQRFLGQLEKKLIEERVDIRLNHPVASILHEDQSVVVTTADGCREAFAQAVVTLPSAAVPRLVPELAADEKSRHAAIEYQGIVCVSLLLEQSLADFYVTNITDGHVPFTGVIEMSALVDPVEFGGKRLIYLPYYVPEDDPIFHCTDEELRERSLAGLEQMYPEFRREHVLAFRASRVRRVMAISTLNYSERLPPAKTSVPNVFVVNSAQIVNGTLNVNESVKLGEEAAKSLFRSESQSTNVSNRNVALHGGRT